LFHLCAAFSSCDRSCRAGAPGFGRAYHVQFAGSSNESGACALSTCGGCGIIRSLSGSHPALALLGVKQAWVVHGAEGLDEVTITGETLVAACSARAGEDVYNFARGLRTTAPISYSTRRRSD
jgi:hypothetical protein